MRMPRSFLLGETGQANVYHVVTRTAARTILFGDAERETFRKILFKQLRFSGLRCLAWCLMGNHIHLLLEVPDKDAALAGCSDDEILARLGTLKGEYSTRMLLGQIKLFREGTGNAHSRELTKIADRVRARLFDLSAFMKELKMKMTGAYNIAHGRRGTLWEGRFKSGGAASGGGLHRPESSARRAGRGAAGLSLVQLRGSGGRVQRRAFGTGLGGDGEVALAVAPSVRRVSQTTLRQR